MDINGNTLKAQDWTETVKQILQRGNVAEVKREKNNIVVIEIKRQLKNKTAMN